MNKITYFFNILGESPLMRDVERTCVCKLTWIDYIPRQAYRDLYVEYIYMAIQGGFASFDLLYFALLLWVMSSAVTGDTAIPALHTVPTKVNPTDTHPTLTQS